MAFFDLCFVNNEKKINYCTLKERHIKY